MKPSDLLTDESRWCKNHLALDSNGQPIAASVTACRLCLMGAIMATVSADDYQTALEKIRVVLRDRGHISSIADWNDSAGTSFQHVKDLLLLCGL